MESSRKIERMYKHFGRSCAGKCKDCGHFSKFAHRGRIYRKCKVYGISASEATDWNSGFNACGLYPGKPYKGGAIVRLAERENRKKEQIEGQQSLFDQRGAE